MNKRTTNDQKHELTFHIEQTNQRKYDNRNETPMSVRTHVLTNEGTGVRTTECMHIHTNSRTHAGIDV